MLRKIFMRNDLSKERFRNEWKYLISTSEKELLELRMKHLLKKDPNAKGNGYMIRSLYFEDYFNSAYAEKESGVLMRKKYRIRIYDCSDRSIKLERKKKFGSYIYKESAPLTKEEFYRILDGDYQFLLKSPYPLCREFYVECVSNLMLMKLKLTLTAVLSLIAQPAKHIRLSLSHLLFKILLKTVV